MNKEVVMLFEVWMNNCGEWVESMGVASGRS